MSYIAGSSAAIVTDGLSDLYIFNSETGVSYEHEPYVRSLGISANNQTFANLVISSGGTVTNSKTTVKNQLNTFRNVEIHNGGLLSGLTGGVASNVTIHSGGSFFNAGFTLSGVTVSSGATIADLFTGATVICGDVRVASGAKVMSGTTDLKAYTDADGWWHNMKVTGAVHLRGGAKALDPVINSWLYLSAGVTVSGGTNAKGKGGMIVLANASAVNFTLSSALVFDLNYTGATLGGTKANLTATPIYICSGAFTSAAANRDPNLAITNGVITGMTLVDNGVNHLRDITLTEGIRVNDAVVSDGGTLSLIQEATAYNPVISDGGYAVVLQDAQMHNATVQSGAKLNITSGGSLFGGTIQSGGSLSIHNRSYLSNTTIESGAYSLASNFGEVYNVQVAAGAKFEIKANVVFAGAQTNIAQGAIYYDGAYRELMRVENGVLYGLNNEGMALHIRSGFAVSGGTFRGYIHASGGTLINGVDFVKTNGLIVSSGGVAENVIINSGAEVRLYEGSLLSNAIISSGGNLRFYNVDATVRGGVLSAGAATWTMTSGSLIEDMEIHANVKVSTGATFSGGLIGLGGTVSVGQGGNVFGTVVSGTNGVTTLGLYDPNASGTIQGRARISGSDIDIRQGTALLRGSNVYVDNVRVSGGLTHLQNGGHFTNFTIYGGEVQCYANDTNGAIGGIPVEAWTDMHLDHVVMSGGSLRVNSFGNVSDITMYAGKMTVQRHANRNSGGYVEGLIQSGGTVDVHDIGIVSGATLVGAAYMTADTGAVLNDFTLSSGANLIVSGATLTNATFYDSTWTIFSNATVRNVDMMFTSGGRVIFSNGVTADGIRVSATQKDLTVLSLCGTAEANDVTLYNAYVFLSGGGKVTNAVLSGGALIARGKGGVYENTIVRGGDFTIQNGGSAFHTVVSGGMMSVGDRPGLTNPAGTDSYAEDIDLLAGSARVSSGGTVSAVRVSGGATLNLISGAAFDATAFANGNVYISGGATLNNGDIREGATVKFVQHENKAMLQGAGTDIAAGTLYYNGATAALGASVESGIVKNLGADGQTYRLSFGDDIIVKEALVNDNCRISGFGGAVLSGVTVAGKTAAASVILTENATAYDTVLNGSNGKTTLLAISANATAYDTVVNSGGTLRFNGNTAKAVGTVVNSGGIIEYTVTGTGFGSIEDTVVKAGGTLTLSDTADTGANLTLDFTGAGAGAKTIVNDLALVSDTTTVYVKGAEQAAGTYTLGNAGTLDTVTRKWGLYENALANGGTYDDALNGLTYAFNGTAVTATALSITTGAAAGLTGDNYTALRTNDRAAKWTSAADNATLVTEAFNGDAYLTVAGNAAKAIYGAGVDYAGTVNINAKSGTIRNLAAGAEAGKTVGAVKLTFDGATLDGTGYAGGFGSVANAAETLIAQGTFTKDFYAGALANYAKTGDATLVGDVSLTIEDGTFSGNIYGASAVKAGSATSTVHSVGAVNITVTGGATTKGTQACLFAGGYATGSDLSDTAVYTVDSVTATISGGSWGTAAGGRGVFGGAFASGVKVEAGAVNLTISGGTMGNVYGGGWSQKEGTSTVGDVAISISGGTVANVFGGGSHSTSGGTTEAGDVTITVSGGDISGAIYARGQLDGDTVANSTVIFTGAKDFSCGVYGYSYVGAADASDATLTFAGYRGTFAGEIGGFDSIEFNDGTAMTLATLAADVANTSWKFDVAARSEALADTAMLNWSAADFSGDTIALNLTTGQSAEWTLVDAATDTNYHQFDVLVDGVSQGVIALDEQIASGDYKGWGFTLEDSALKFKNLA